MRRIAAVVVEKALFEIVRGTDIAFARMGFGSEEIDVVHGILGGGGIVEGSAFAEATADAPAFGWSG